MRWCVQTLFKGIQSNNDRIICSLMTKGGHSTPSKSHRFAHTKGSTWHREAGLTTRSLLYCFSTILIHTTEIHNPLFSRLNMVKVSPLKVVQPKNTSFWGINLCSFPSTYSSIRTPYPFFLTMLHHKNRHQTYQIMITFNASYPPPSLRSFCVYKSLTPPTAVSYPISHLNCNSLGEPLIYSMCIWVLLSSIQFFITYKKKWINATKWFSFTNFFGYFRTSEILGGIFYIK